MIIAQFLFLLCRNIRSTRENEIETPQNKSQTQIKKHRTYIEQVDKKETEVYL